MKKKKHKQVHIVKASGTIIPFSEKKFKTSLKRSGASEETASSILHDIRHHLYEGISSGKIYRIARQLLKERSKPLAAKYHLKRGIMELGPSGYAFEKFVGEILKYQGYQVTLGEIVQGKCVTHEIDVIAEKDNHHFMIECKYHNHPGTVSDVKIPLYIQARFKDVEEAWLLLPGHQEKFHQGWVVTNTRFTGDAIKFGTCAGLRLIGWDYPFNNSLKDQIDQLGLYPITCLTTLTKTEKQLLLAKNIVLGRELCEDPKPLTKIGISEGRIKSILNETSQLCQNREFRSEQ